MPFETPNSVDKVGKHIRIIFNINMTYIIFWHITCPSQGK